MELKDYTNAGLAALESAIAEERLRRHERRLVYVITRGTPAQTFCYGLDEPHESPPEGEGVEFVMRPANHPDNVVLRSLYGGQHDIGFADKDHPDLVMADDGRNPPKPTLRAYTGLVDDKHVPARWVSIDGYDNPINRMLDTHQWCTDGKWWPAEECTEHALFDEDGAHYDSTYTHNLP
jgi:hypothetical protein